MGITRRQFLACMGAEIGLNSLLITKAQAITNQPFSGYPESLGVLHDISRCIGCRQCETACNRINNLPAPERPFEDLKVLNRRRRTHYDAYTVVNRFFPAGKVTPVFVKSQCNHCLEPACVSACFVQALKKSPSGAVTYDPSLCVGCRYCMIACPFNIPAYEYHEPFSPRVVKCNLCFARIQKRQAPACVEICPQEALIFGPRAWLIKTARQRIYQQPDRYIDHIFGEHEAGGLSWLYIANAPFKDIGMNTQVGTMPAARLTSGPITMFPMVAVMGLVLLTGIYAISKRKDQISAQEQQAEVNGRAYDLRVKAERQVAQAMPKAYNDRHAAGNRDVKKVLDSTAKQAQVLAEAADIDRLSGKPPQSQERE